MDKVLYCGGKYFAIYNPNHHRASKDGYVYEHIIKAEEKLKRPLKNEEVVHHIDFNGLNNKLENLMVFKNSSEHTKYHQAIKYNTKFVLINNNNVFSIICEEHRCLMCGNKISNKRYIYCQKCISIKNRKINRPERNILKNDIRTLPMIKVGKKYGVSDNAIRKWCIYYKLPFKSTIIKKISNEEWNVI